jgi:hypothetical protein
MDETLLTLVCVGEHFEFLRFIGLGQLDGSQLATEFEKRQPVTHGMYGLAVEAWQALLSPEPERLFRLAARPTGALPYLGEAVLRLLEEYPSLLNGLSRLEQQVMEAAVSGITHPGRLFQETQHMELRPFAGDTTLFGIVERLARAGRPLLTVEGPGPLPLWEPEALERWRIQPTELGYQIFSRQAHHAEVNGIDRWIGGVHLSDENLYLWDGASERIVRWGARQ